MEGFTPELKRLLLVAGCAFVRAGKGDHEIWRSPITEVHFVVDSKIKSRHTANAVLKHGTTTGAFSGPLTGKASSAFSDLQRSHSPPCRRPSTCARWSRGAEAARSAVVNSTAPGAPILFCLSNDSNAIMPTRFPI